MKSIFAAAALLWVAAGSAALAIPIVQDDFTFIYTSGPRTGIHGAGFVTFDAGQVPATGSAELTAANGASITITDFGGQIETSGPFFIGQPSVFFTDGALVSVFATYVPPGATDNNRAFSLFSDGTLFARETSGDLIFSRGTVTYQPFNVNDLNAVPEPATIGLLVAGLIGIATARRRTRISGSQPC
jgi:hypothetical protein